MREDMRNISRISVYCIECLLVTKQTKVDRKVLLTDVFRSRSQVLF